MFFHCYILREDHGISCYLDSWIHIPRWSPYVNLPPTLEAAVTQSGGIDTRNFILSQSWRPEAQDQGPRSWKGVRGAFFGGLSPWPADGYLVSVLTRASFYPSTLIFSTWEDTVIGSLPTRMTSSYLMTPVQTLPPQTVHSEVRTSRYEFGRGHNPGPDREILESHREAGCSSLQATQ